ncbi:4Fe-4S binding protein [Halococcoides cellulosivorans]|uniref:Ferredoxin n=1 Tax=Halococcoides cellulosivorans TaxID=1679096 RepID=A0A2R4WZY2_9EURY|nr:4Fe-4S binding protein [Halococcoides cellulosivorans]AWB27098.1 pyruvate synthase [Halococcoides cellulosivorans]
MSSDPYENLSISTGAVAQPNTSLVNKTGSWRQFRPVIDADACIGCGQCDTYCPDQAAKQVDDQLYGIDLDYCKGCGICAEECPTDAIEMIREDS